MKRYLILLSFIAIALVACQKENLSEQAVSGNSIYATIEQPADETKTTLAGASVQWVAADAIKLWDSDGSTGVYTTTTSGADVEFTAVSSEATVDVDKQLYGFYPSDHFVSKTGSNITFSITGEQGYVANSFGDNSNYAVADKPAVGTGDNKLHFKNVAGVLKIQLSVADGDAATVGKIVLSSNAGEPDASKYICGTFTVDASADSPVATYTSAGDTTITLNCGTAGVALSDDSSNPTTFHIVVPAGSFTTGFTAKVYSLQDHLITTLSSTKAQTIVRSVVRLMKNKEVNWLPSGYTECKYISPGSTKGPMINTGVIPYYGMDVHTINYYNPSEHFTTMLFGVEQYPSSLIDVLIEKYSSGTVYYDYRIMGANCSPSQTGYRPTVPEDPKSFILELRESTSYIHISNGIGIIDRTVTNGTKNLPTAGLCIFGSQQSGAAKDVLCYEFSIKNNSGSGTSAEKERRLIPAMNPSSAYGMYDVLNEYDPVENGFFGNVGTGTLTGSL